MRVDIRLDDNWQLTQAANGDAPVVSGYDSLLQEIRLEAVTQEGELFYDPAWGWSLLDFMQSQDDELTRLEIRERIAAKLGQRPEVDVETIQTEIVFTGDAVVVNTSFSFLGDNQVYSIDLQLDRVRLEVRTND